MLVEMTTLDGTFDYPTNTCTFYRETEITPSGIISVINTEGKKNR